MRRPNFILGNTFFCRQFFWIEALWWRFGYYGERDWRGDRFLNPGWFCVRRPR
jgi:hypothetical protein